MSSNEAQELQVGFWKSSTFHCSYNFPRFLSALTSNNAFIIKTWSSVTPDVVVRTLKISLGEAKFTSIHVAVTSSIEYSYKEKKEKEVRKRTLRKIKEQGGPSYKLFWSDLKGGHRNKKRSIPRLKSRIGKTIDEPMEVSEELAKHCEDLGKHQTNGWSNYCRDGG